MSKCYFDKAPYFPKRIYNETNKCFTLQDELRISPKNHKKTVLQLPMVKGLGQRLPTQFVSTSILTDSLAAEQGTRTPQGVTKADKVYCSSSGSPNQAQHSPVSPAIFKV